MARTDELKRRVDRLLRGGTNTRDLDVLFLWLRQRSFGNRAVADIGDFVGHSDEREKGIAWRGVHSFATVVGYHVPRLMEKDHPPPTLEEVKALVVAAFDLDAPDKVRSKFGMGKQKLGKVLKRSPSRVRPYGREDTEAPPP